MMITFRNALVFACIGLCFFAPAQTAQVGADAAAKNLSKLSVEYVGYRPARYETEHVVELDNSNPNEGGFITAYLRNNTDKPINLRFWRLNGKDESHYRVDMRSIWDRTYHDTLAPGQMTPAPWVNVIANRTFGTVVSESGSAYTWVENAHECRLTPWSNDPVQDPSGEAFYLRAALGTERAAGVLFFAERVGVPDQVELHRGAGAGFRCRAGCGRLLGAG